MALENDMVYGSVNANQRHCEKTAAALSESKLSWLEQIITRRIPIVN
ncbi:MAG: hypothetical protein H7222_14390 [Methylotenera sp.]|nr:hypothetical protein [Oligoflexia bacterium]